MLHDRVQPPRAIALIDTDAGTRALVGSDDAQTVAGMEAEEWVGRRVRVAAGRLIA